MHSEPPAPTEGLTQPRFAALWAGATYALATLLLGWPALLGKFLVNPNSDMYIGGYAFRQFAAASISRGAGVPQWNPYIYGGMPFVAAMNGDIFYPTALLRLVLPPDVGMTWGFILHVFLAGCFTYAFLRAAGLGFAAALLGGLAYLLTGPIASYVSPGHDGKLFVSALYPLALWILTLGVRDGRPWAWGVFALVVGLAVVSPHPQLLQYLLLSTGAWGLYIAFADEGRGRLPRPVAVRRLGLALGAVVVGGLIGAIQYWPVHEYVAWSPRAGGKQGWEHAVSYSFPPEELLNMVVPQFSGILDAYWGRNGIHLHSEYLGVVALLIAGLAFTRAWAAPQRRFLWFWTGTLVVSLLWALGGFTPFYSIVYAIVPGTRYFRAPSTIIYITGFSVAVLVALGIERLTRFGVRRRYAVGWLAAAGVVALLGVSGGLTALATGIAGSERADLVQANATAVGVGALRSFLFLALGAAALLALARDALTRRAAVALLGVLVALDLWSVERLYWRFSPPARVLYAPDPAIEYVRSQPVPGRVLALPPREQSSARHDPNLGYDGLMVHRVRAVLGYHGNELARYDDLTQGLGSANVWRLLNIKYLLTDVPDSPLPGSRKLVGPVTDAAGSTTYLFDVPGDNPLAWIVPLVVQAPDDAVLATLLDPRFDVRRAALFDTAAGVDGAKAVTSLPSPLPIAVQTVAFAPGRIALRLDAPAPAQSALVVSENFYPGWRAAIDGRPAPAYRADYSLIGVALPTGAREVTLTFRSDTYETGKAIALVGLAAAVVALATGLAVSRRSGG